MARIPKQLSTFLEILQENPNFSLQTYLAKLNKLETNLERVNYVYKDFQTIDMFIKSSRNLKNDEKAIKLRNCGNEFFRMEKHREALDCYTQSIMNAESKDVLALAYGNRSAALSKLDFFEECLEDIERAFQNDYPDDLKEKLLQRQELAVSKKSPKEKPYESVPDFPEFERNPLIQSARNCVEIKQNEEFGRHVVATRRIEVGQIIAVEKPYSLFVFEEELVYCHECCQLCYNMIPCENCTCTLYCSEECKSKAASYHKYECQLLNVVNKGLIEKFQRLVLKITFLGCQTDENNDPIYRSDRFKEIYNLMIHTKSLSDLARLNAAAITCLFFRLIKEKTTFLADYNNEDKLKDVLFQMCMVCYNNTVDIQEFSLIDVIKLYDLNSIAVAIYSFFSLFNHSCWANVERSFHGSSIVLRALNTIQPGEQCFVNYGPNYVTDRKCSRDKLLNENYFFTCKCLACRENWPVIDKSTNLSRLNCMRVSSLSKEAKVSDVMSQLAFLLNMARKAERDLPPGKDYYQKDALLMCYQILGNKRRV